MIADAMTDAVLGAAALAAELDAERADEAAERRMEAEHQAEAECLRTAYSLYAALDGAVGGETDPGPIESDRLFAVACDPFAAGVTTAELAACVLWCSNRCLAAVRVALRDRVMAANADVIRMRATELEAA